MIACAAYSEHVGAKRQLGGSKGETRRWYPRTARTAARTDSLSARSGLPSWRETPHACPRPARSRSPSARRYGRSRRDRRLPARSRAPPGRPHEVAGGPDCAVRLREPGAPPRSRRGEPHRPHATARSSTVARLVCPAGTASESQHPRSAARADEDARLHREPFPPLRPAALQRLAPTRRLHSLAKAMRLLPPALVRLKRALHER